MINLIRNLTKKEFGLLVIIFILVYFQIYLDLKLPEYMSEITMLVQKTGSNLNDIYIAGFKMLICAFVSLGLAIIVAIISARIASNFSFIIRNKVFVKVMSFSMKEVNSFSTPSLITRTTNDIVQVQMFIVMGLQMLIKAPLTAIFAITKIYTKNYTWTLITATAIGILLVVIFICFILAVPKFKILQKLTDNINRIAREHLDGLNVIRAFNAEKYQNDRFELANKELTETNLFAYRTLAFLQPSIQMINSTLTLVIYLAGAVMINEALGLDKLSLFSDMVTFSSYAMQALMSFMMLVLVFLMLPRASVAANRINEIIMTDNSIKDGTLQKGNDNKIGEVEFVNVSFKYPDADDYVLENISFKVKKGETLALIGATGSGKSTIINLIPRFYDATSGSILVNGKDIKEYSKNTLSSIIGYVSQKAILFKGNIESNIIFGDNDQIVADDELLNDAIKVAQADEFISNLDDKNQAYVAQGGKNLSGGQKQRISIARAIYRNPDILIFDDSFSALDYKTDQKLRKSLNEECKDKTRIIVGQRIGTIKDADNIIVINDGRIDAMGTHEYLLENSKLYKQIALSQLSIEEL